MNELFGMAFVIAILAALVGIIWHDKREGRLAWAVMVIAVIVMITNWSSYRVKAQGFNPPSATFYTSCVDLPGDGSMIVRWGYDATAEMDFMGSGYEFTTQVGHYPQAFEYIVPNAALPDVPLLGLGFHDHSAPGVDWVAYTQYIQPDVGSPACNVSTEPTAPVVTPIVQTDECPAYSLNGATGEKFCLWTLPKAVKLGG